MTTAVIWSHLLLEQLLTVEAPIQSVLQVIIGCLLHDLGVLQTLDQLEFLLLHQSNLGLKTQTRVVKSRYPLTSMASLL
jgi:hypothetical protein